MAAPSAVFTIPSSGYSNGFAAGTLASLARVAAMLGEDEDWLWDVALEMDPEDGRMTVYGINDEDTTGFTSFGIENLKELIEMHKAIRQY